MSLSCPAKFARRKKCRKYYFGSIKTIKREKEEGRKEGKKEGKKEGRKGKERKGKERKGKERKGKERGPMKEDEIIDPWIRFLQNKVCDGEINNHLL